MKDKINEDFPNATMSDEAFGKSSSIHHCRLKPYSRNSHILL